MVEVVNKYEVPKKQRKKRSPMARNMFNYMIHTGEFMFKMGLFHPHMSLPTDQFAVINWNLAWSAAEHTNDKLFTYPKIDGETAE